MNSRVFAGISVLWGCYIKTDTANLQRTKIECYILFVYKKISDIKNAPVGWLWAGIVLYLRSKQTGKHMIEGVVLTLVLMTFCIGSAIGIVNYGTKGRFF